MKLMPIEQFQQWIKTPRGRTVIKAVFDQCEKQEDEKCLENCLWWAFYGGQRSGDMQYSECGWLIRMVFERFHKQMSRSMRRQFENVLIEYEGIKAKGIFVKTEEILLHIQTGGQRS